jgi:hypothetical protein
MLPGITTSNSFSGNDVTRVWTYTFQILTTDGSDVQLYTTDALGVVTAVNANYSVDVANSQVTYPTIVSGLDPLATGVTLTVLRAEALTQETDLVNQGSLDAEVLEASLDKLTAITQQLQREINSGLAVSGTILQGASGHSGVSGASGISGLDGQSHASGTSGFSGASLVSGWSGTSGTSGTSGVSGASLVSGWSGVSGTSGTSGTSGVSGASLVSGWSGTSGYSGIDGASGVSGSSNISGFSGKSGVSGFGGGTFTTSFADGDISASGWIPINHSLALQYNAVIIFDDGGVQVLPDEVVATDANNCSVSLGSQGTISGTWNAVIKY